MVGDRSNVAGLKLEIVEATGALGSRRMLEHVIRCEALVKEGRYLDGPGLGSGGNGHGCL